MTELAAHLTWLLGQVMFMAARLPFQRGRARERIRLDRVSGQERTLLVLVWVGMFLLPLITIATGWPAFAGYDAGPLPRLTGALLLVPTLWLFWRSHRDLGLNWSVSLQVRERHELVTGGVYARVRHPMYAAIFAWCFAQALLIQNWIAGPAGLVAFGLLYASRVAREEALMREASGESYRAYEARTHRLVPGLI